MRAFESPKLLKVNRRLVLSAILLMGGMGHANVQSVEAVGRETEIQRSTGAEAKAYEEWYRVFRDRNLGRVIELGESYLHAYPDGVYAAFISRIIDFARTSLNPNQRKRAESLRFQVTESLADSAQELAALLRQILNTQSEVDTKVRTGATALMFAAANGDREAVRALIDKQADIDAAESTQGWTALIYAIWSGDHFNVRYLLEFYPDADMKDKEGRTAMDHAKATGDFEMMLLINGRPRRGSAS